MQRQPAAQPPSDLDSRRVKSAFPSSSFINNEDTSSDQPIAKGGVAYPFPWRLHHMLEAAKDEDDEDIVSWQPHGRAFKVHKQKEFVEKYLKRFFRQSKYPSFQRQLNLYGFSRLSHGPDKGAYFHFLFVHGQRSLVRGMIRQKVKGNRVRRALPPDEEPNFYAPEWDLNSYLKTLTSPESFMVMLPNYGVFTAPPPVAASPSSAQFDSEVQQRFASSGDPQDIVQPSTPLGFEQACSAVPVDVVPPSPEPTRLVAIWGENEDLLAPADKPGEAKDGELLFFEGSPFHFLEDVYDENASISLEPTPIVDKPKPKAEPAPLLSKYQDFRFNCFHQDLLCDPFVPPQLRFLENEQPPATCLDTYVCRFFE